MSEKQENSGFKSLEEEIQEFRKEQADRELKKEKRAKWYAGSILALSTIGAAIAGWTGIDNARHITDVKNEIRISRLYQKDEFAVRDKLNQVKGKVNSLEESLTSYPPGADLRPFQSSVIGTATNVSEIGKRLVDESTLEEKQLEKYKEKLKKYEEDLAKWRAIKNPRLDDIKEIIDNTGELLDILLEFLRIFQAKRHTEKFDICLARPPDVKQSISSMA
jgi:vacuolar-type H+-ATPase subunit I/STV1